MNTPDYKDTSWVGRHELYLMDDNTREDFDYEHIEITG